MWNNIQYCKGGKMVLPNATTSNRRRLQTSGEFIPANAVCYPNHTGTFCYGCAAGYTKRGTDRLCTLCDDSSYAEDAGKLGGIFLAIIVAVLFALGFVFYFTHRSYQVRKGASKRSLAETRAYDIYTALDISILVQIVVGFIQVVSGMSATFREVLPPFFRQLRDVFAVLALDFINIFDFGCTLSAQNHYTSLLLSTLVPLGFLLVLLLIHAMLAKFVAKQDLLLRSELRITTFTIFLVVLFLVYPSCSNKVLATFSCRTMDDGSSTITVDPSTSCVTPQYQGFAVYAAFMVFVYPLGVPVLYATFLYRERNKLNPFARNQNLDKVAEAMRAEDRSIAYLYFLWKPYKARYFWFGEFLVPCPKFIFWGQAPKSSTNVMMIMTETFELIRKLAQTSIVVFIAPGSSPQIVFQLLVTVVSVVVLNSLTPYVQRKHNLLAAMAQWSIFGISLVTLLIKFNRLNSLNEYDQSSLDRFMVFLFLIIPVTAILLIVLQIIGAFRVVMFCVDWEVYLDRHPKLAKVFRYVSDDQLLAKQSRRVSIAMSRLAGAASGDAKKPRNRHSIVMMEKLATSATDDKKWVETFELAKVEWQSELNSQIEKANTLQELHEKDVKEVQHLKEQLRHAMVEVAKLRSLDSQNQMAMHQLEGQIQYQLQSISENGHHSQPRTGRGAGLLSSVRQTLTGGVPSISTNPIFTREVVDRRTASFVVSNNLTPAPGYNGSVRNSTSASGES